MVTPAPDARGTQLKGSAATTATAGTAATTATTTDSPALGGRTTGTHGSAPTTLQGARAPRVGTRVHPGTQGVPESQNGVQVLQHPWHSRLLQPPRPPIRATPEGQDEATSLHIPLSPPQPEATGTPVPMPAMLGTVAAAAG